MASGRPDWNQITVMSGKYGEEFLPVLLDALGQLYAVLRGDYSGTPTTVALDAAGRILAHLVALDGSTVRDVALDAAGKLITRLQGYDGSTLRDIKVDDTGQIMALLRGLYGSTLKTIAVDTDGVMMANLSAQDLDFLRVRPVYGQARALINNPLLVETATWETLADISGQGATNSGNIYWDSADPTQGNSLKLTVDGTVIFYEDIMDMNTFKLGVDWAAPFKLLLYDTTNNIYSIAIAPNYTFETSYKLELYNISLPTISVYRWIYYSLVPS